MKHFAFTDRQLIILYELAHTDNITASTLSLSLGVSIRTIKKEIKILKEILREYDIYLDSIPGVGYHISQDSSNKTILTSLFNSKFLKRAHKFYKSNHERVNHIIVTLLFAKEYIKIDDLASSMYIARSTINNDIKEVRSQLLKYDIRLVSKPSHGVMIDGSETSIRDAILDYVFYSNSIVDDIVDHEFFENTEEINLIVENLSNCLKGYNISDYSVLNIARITYIANYRIKQNKYIEANDKKTDSVFLAISESILLDLEYEWKLWEKIRLSQYIIVNIMYKETKSLVYLNLVEDIVEEVYRNFGLNLSSFKEDNMIFAAHIEQMINRLNHGTLIRNPMLYENLRKYIYASKLAISATKIIEEKMDVMIPLEEFSFIVLYFQNILYRIKDNKKVTISFEKGNNFLENLVYKQEIEKYFDHQDVVICEDGLKDADIKVSLRMNTEKETIAIEKKNYLQLIRKEVLRLRQENIEWEKYLIDGSVVANIECNSKEELFDYIINHFKSLDILKHDNVTSSDFISLELGSQILHFQDYGKVLEKPIVFIGVLSKPIIYDKTSIKVIVHIKTKKDGDKDLLSICNALSLWINSESDLAKFIESPSNELFSNMIVRYL